MLRYDNALPERPVRRLITALTDEGDHMVDPFLGSGTTARACHALRRRCTAADINVHALRFAIARLLDEHIWRCPAPPTTPRLRSLVRHGRLGARGEQSP